MVQESGRHMTATGDLHSERFFVTKEDTCKLVRHATPLFLVLADMARSPSRSAWSQQSFFP